MYHNNKTQKQLCHVLFLSHKPNARNTRSFVVEAKPQREAVAVPALVSHSESSQAQLIYQLVLEMSCTNAILFPSGSITSIILMMSGTSTTSPCGTFTSAQVAHWVSMSFTPTMTVDVPARSGSSVTWSQALSASCHSATPSIGTISGPRPNNFAYHATAPS